MCVIAYKPTGVKLPSKKQFRTMFSNNPDGCGFMYAENGRVYIHKGFMEYSDFRRAIKPFIGRNDLPMVFHFRIATHGGINQSMCQPFPLTNKVKALKALTKQCDVGVAHNGIIPMTYDARDISDTALFIQKYMTRILANGIDNIALDIIETCIDSKMCILENNGRAHIIGRGWTTENGIHFSNDSFKTYRYTRKTSAGKTGKTEKSTSNAKTGLSVYNGFCSLDCEECPYYKYCYDTDSAVDAGLNSIYDWNV